MEKRKIYGLIIGIILFVIMMAGITYAYFYWSSGSSNDTNVSLIVSKDLQGLVVYNKGSDIIIDSDHELNYSQTYKGGAKTTITFGKTSSANIDIYGQLFLNIKNLSATGAISRGVSVYDQNNNLREESILKWTLTRVVSSSDTSYTKCEAIDSSTKECVVGTGDFKGKKTGDRISLIDYVNGSSANIKDENLSSTYKTFNFYLWLDASLEQYQNQDSFSAEVSASATTERGYYGMSPLQVVTSLGLLNNVKNNVIDFGTVSTDSDTGVYVLPDDLGVSYYFRGNVTNNYVKFAGFYWRIVRINGDGSIRMIYDGTSAHANGASSADKSIGNSAYQATNYNHNTYVGYMYGSTSGGTFATVHTNATDSSIKTAVDNWYLTNIVNKGFGSYVSDAIYCNDRTVASSASGDGTGTSITNYGVFDRLRTNKKPILKCLQANDRFTLIGSKLAPLDGNGTNQKLTYPVGLITADEVALAGAVDVNLSLNNTSFYLRSGSFYYTMTPFAFQSSTPYIVGVGSTGNINNATSYTSYTVRPVISLRADAINYDNVTSGSTDGSSLKPFVIK